MAKFQQALRVVYRLTGVIALIGWFYHGHLQSVYFHRPQEPRADLGWITPYEIKGLTVYVSPDENILASWLLYGSIALIVVTFASWKLGTRKADFTAKQRPSP
jgi:hypothetical protein